MEQTLIGNLYMRNGTGKVGSTTAKLIWQNALSYNQKE
jgi:hypothetical protein